MIALIIVCLVGLTTAQDTQLRAKSSRFRQLASSTWGENQPTPPVVINLENAAPRAQSLGRRQITPQGDPNLLNHGAPASQPLRIPQGLTELLGLENMAIPGILETGGSPQAAQAAVSALSSQFAGNPTWAHLAANNPQLMAQLTADGLANQQILSGIAAAPSTSQSNKFTAQQEAIINAINRDGRVNKMLGTEPQLTPTDGETGLMRLLGAVTQRLAQTTGVRDLIQQTGPAMSQAFGGGFASPPIPQSDLGSSVVGQNGPPVAGLPRLPNVAPLLPGGIPRDESGQIDYVRLMSRVTQRVTNGSTLSDVLPPNQLQNLADNITGALLPSTPEVDLTKFMGRWFEGVNSPRATEQRCIVHHYGGLTDNEKTSTFTALKIYREGSEFGQVRYSIGYAFRGGDQQGMLQMHTSESTDPAPYWIYKIGPLAPDSFGNDQYEYAVVSNWVKYPVTVLVRDPDVFAAKYEQDVLKYLEENGFINGFIRAFNMLQPVSYENCQYSDSTFQVFGK